MTEIMEFRAQREKPLLQAVDLVKVFGEGESRVDALRGVNLHVDEGEMVLILGPSGSGKTTLLSLLGGLLHPTSGQVILDGTGLSALSERELPSVRLRSIGFIFQRFNLLTSLTASENVEIALNFAGLRGPAASERARKLLTELGMGHRLDVLAPVLSGGEQQRVAIARALANEPPIILADEPTSNLDSHQGVEVVSLLRDLGRKGRRSVVVVSHDERIAGFADRVLRIDDGRVVAGEIESSGPSE